MDHTIEEDLQHVLAGKAVSSIDVNDLSDVRMHPKEHYVPVTKKTVTYIVVGIFFNDKGEILMMQEAKKDCYQTWYLPAGRMEPNETIEEGVIREVHEETGLLCQPTTLLSVQVNQGNWYRFTMTGIITGGKLKTTDQRDEESLQAGWFPVDEIKNKRIPIRANDIFKLIDIAVAYRSAAVKHADLRPAIKPHTKLLLRIVLVHCTSERNEVKLLTDHRKRNHLPVTLLTHRDFMLNFTLLRICEDVFGPAKLSMSLRGVLSVEHSGRPAAINDGICITVLASLNDPSLPEIVAKDSFVWLPVGSDDLKKEILERLSDGRNVPVVDC